MITEKQSVIIKKKMLEQKITVTQLANEFGFSRPLVSSVISGRLNNSNIENLLKERFIYKKQ